MRLWPHCREDRVHTLGDSGGAGRLSFLLREACLVSLRSSSSTELRLWSLKCFSCNKVVSDVNNVGYRLYLKDSPWQRIPLHCRCSVSGHIHTEGCNSTSGSVCACHAVALSSIPGARGIGLWRFISRLSTLETVYLLWLAWPRKMAEPSRWLGVGRKRTTENDKLPGSDHSQCPPRLLIDSI